MTNAVNMYMKQTSPLLCNGYDTQVVVSTANQTDYLVLTLSLVGDYICLKGNSFLALALMVEEETTMESELWSSFVPTVSV